MPTGEMSGYPRMSWALAGTPSWIRMGGGPRIWFQVVPERKAAKNRLHMDIKVSGGRAVPSETRRQRVDAEAARLDGRGDSRGCAFVPRFAWAVLIVVTSPVGGLVYLLAQRLRKRSPEPMTMRPRPPLLGSGAGHGPALAKYRRSPAPSVSHGVAVVAISGVMYLVAAGKVLDAAGVMVVLAIIVFLRSTSPGR
jgi:hypothetical protein